jgi:uncharacterized membrane protein YphA (DoxX/SURF4 family)
MCAVALDHDAPRAVPPWLVASAPFYARVALGAAFLSAVASRFGIWAGTPGLAAFDAFTAGYAAQVLSFVPPATVPFLIWCATIAETTLGIALILGIQLRWVATASALLLALFATAMAISFGPKSPLEYSVYSASAAALLLAVDAWSRSSAARK